MKKIVTAADLGGAPFSKADLRELFNQEIWAAIEGHMNAFSNNPTGNYGVIVSGCAIVANGGGFDISAGVVFLNGEFMRMPAYTAQTFTKYIAAKTPTQDNRIFSDGGNHAVVETKEAELVGAAPGAGQYVTISSLTSANFRYLKAFVPGVQYVNASGVHSFKVLRTKIIEIGDWDMDATTSKSVTHDLPDYKKIRGVTAIIRNDADTDYSPIDRLNVTQEPAGAVSGTTGLTTIISLIRYVGGFYDQVDYNATSYNRGWITITYEE